RSSSLFPSPRPSPPASPPLSLHDALPILLALYAALVLLTSQVLVILRIRFPKAPVRALTGLVFILSILPAIGIALPGLPIRFEQDRKSTRLNSSHGSISYAVFCLKKKTK